MRIEAQRRPAAAAARLDRRAAAARAGALQRRPPQRARARRGHLRPPRPAHAAAARARAARPVRARPARGHRRRARRAARAPARLPGHRDARAGRTASTRTRAPSLTAAAETEIDGLRPHREGAPASRIHWPALARGAGLMERKLISEADSRPLVVLDPRAPESPEALDAAVRAAASLTVHFAKRGGCGLLLPGDRRAHVIERDLLAWPQSHVRLALVDEHTGPALMAAQNRRGLIAYVAARTVDRVPRGLGRTPGGCLLVIPGALPNRRAVIEVAGCQRLRRRAHRQRGADGDRRGGADDMSAARPRQRPARHRRPRCAAPSPTPAGARRTCCARPARCSRSRSPAAPRSSRSRRSARCTGWRCSSRPPPARAWYAVGAGAAGDGAGCSAPRACAAPRALARGRRHEPVVDDRARLPRRRRPRRAAAARPTGTRWPPASSAASARCPARACPTAASTSGPGS